MNRRILALVVLLAGCSSSSGGAVNYHPDAAAGDAGDGGESLCPGGCDPGAVCIDDGTGNHVCAQACTTTGACPIAKNCCTIVPSLPRGHGVCLPYGSMAGQECLCGFETECNSGCCVARTDVTGNPIGPNICKSTLSPAGPYGCPVHGSTGMDPCASASTGSCAAGLCLIIQTQTGSCVCAEPCTNSTQCGGSVCQPLISGTCNSAPGWCVAPDGGS